MKFFIYILLLFSNGIYAQQLIKGRVVDQETKQPLQNVSIINTDSNKWTISNENGYFEFRVVAVKDITLTFRLLGKQEKTITYNKTALEKEILVALETQDLRLDEVIVSARKGKKFSEIELGREVIEQVQAFSINEVLEQLPGQAVTNFNLNEFKPIAFRTVKPSRVGSTGFGNKSFGTSIVVDGIPISNNENMQSYVGNYGAPFVPNLLGFGDPKANDFNGYFTGTDYNSDLREIAVDNIEKIEVVQGVPSAKYGDLTSGLIKIERKAGKSPYQIYTSLRDGATEYGFFKGYQLGERLGHLNVTVNYLKANSEPRVSFTEYERITTSLMWSWASKSKNIRNSFSVDYGFNNDNVNKEEEDTDNKIVKNKKKDLTISNRFKWNLKDHFFDNLDINFNFKYSDHYTYESKFMNNGGSIVGTSINEGVYTGTYTLPSYTSVKAVEGIPISSYLAADLYKTFHTGEWLHNISVGTSFRMSDNKGRGRLGSPETMISIFGITGSGDKYGFRPYNYGDNVRAEYQISLYAEDNITRNWDNSTLFVSTGLRYDNQYGFSSLAPRINSYLEFEKFKIRGGFGITSKAPSLNQVYTGPRYYDAVLGDYRYPGHYNLGIVQTFIDLANNKDLKPTKSIRSELGFDVKLPFGNLNFTGFYNHLYDGITNQSVPTTRSVADLDIAFNGTQTPTYQVVGYSPFYYMQNKLVNQFSSTDKGLEFFLSFEKTPFRNITFDIQGSYIETTNLNDVTTYIRSSNGNKPEKFGVYKPYNEYYKSFRLGSNINYHLPKIGLVIAIRSEHFIIGQNSTDNENRLPYAYIDGNLNTVPIPEQDQGNSSLYSHIYMNDSRVEDKKLQKVYNNFHLRISKDFLNGFRFSFYANNFLSLELKEIATENGTITTRPKPDMVKLSFGTKIEYQF